MIVTDGFEFYGTAIRRVFGPAALYAQVIKTRRHDRVVRVERRAVIGAAWRCAHALSHSEDSSTVNTSFIEQVESDHPAEFRLLVETDAGPCARDGHARRAS